MSEDNDDGKVVPFPTHRVKKPKPATDGTLGQPIGTPSTVQKKTTFLVSLLATMIGATYLADHEPIRDRMPASATHERRELHDDILLARKIARESLRQPASRGREPSAEDILRHGKELQGKYALNFDDAGSLRGLQFRGVAGEESDISDRADFLERNRDLLHIDYDQAKKDEAIDGQANPGDSKWDAKRFEVYNLTQGDTVKAKVHFEMVKDALIKMTVEPNPGP
jgi:hypothetical protein